MHFTGYFQANYQDLFPSNWDSSGHLHIFRQEPLSFSLPHHSYLKEGSYRAPNGVLITYCRVGTSWQ